MTAEMQASVPLRRLPLAGMRNTRDLGGYPCRGGGVTRWGVFLRSDSPHNAQPADIEALRRYGVGTAVDLRGAYEYEAMPSLLRQAPGFTVHEVSLSDQLASADYEGDVPGSMAGLYITILNEAAAELARAVQILAEAEGAALFHCMVGKDRTGVVAMLLLQLAGVGDEDIIADYAVTDIYMNEIFDARLRELAAEGYDIPSHRMSSLPASMQCTLRHLAEAGGAEAYLLRAGLPEESLRRLRAKFVAT